MLHALMSVSKWPAHVQKFTSTKRNFNYFAIHNHKPLRPKTWPLAHQDIKSNLLQRNMQQPQVKIISLYPFIIKLDQGHTDSVTFNKRIPFLKKEKDNSIQFATCSKPRNLVILKFIDGWKRRPPLQGPKAWLNWTRKPRLTCVSPLSSTHGTRKRTMRSGSNKRSIMLT